MIDMGKDAGVGSRWLLGILLVPLLGVISVFCWRLSDQVANLTERMIKIETAQGPLAKAIEGLANEVRQLREARIADEARRTAPKQHKRPARRP